MMKQMRSDGVSRLRLGCGMFVLAFLGGCSGGIVGSGTGSGGDGGAGQGINGSEFDRAELELNFQPDEGIRLACASSPKVKKVGEQWMLYSGETVDSMTVAKSDNAFDFGTMQEIPTRNQEGLLEYDLTGLAGTLSLAPPVTASTSSGSCASASARWYEVEQEGVNGSLTSYCSEDGRWFRKDRVNMPSAEVGFSGSAAVFQFGSGVHLYVLSGASPNLMGEYDQRIWHYLDPKGEGINFSLQESDPLKNGETYEGVPIEKFPSLAEIPYREPLIVTTVSGLGGKATANLVGGELYAWVFDPEIAGAGEMVPYPGGESRKPLLSVESFIAQGLDVIELGAASLVALGQQEYRLFVEAKMAASAAEHLGAQGECISRQTEEGYIPVILSATSKPGKSE